MMKLYLRDTMWKMTALLKDYEADDCITRAGNGEYHKRFYEVVAPIIRAAIKKTCYTTSKKRIEELADRFICEAAHYYTYYKALGVRVNFGQTRDGTPVIGSPLLPSAIDIYNERAGGLLSCCEAELRLADDERKEENQ